MARSNGRKAPVISTPVLAITRYVPAIDGLRAVAVLSVVLFHAGFASFSGGFVGVDVFFVISGFLITRNIVEELDKGEFSFGRFYLRRARRLLPAAFFTLALSLGVGAILLTPEHMRSLGAATIYSIASLSNVFFWQSAGYWDAASETKPLLHFWSLAVEEQFYLVWPALLALTLRLKTHAAIFWLFASLSVLSLWASEAMLDSHPSAVFYLTPFRAFEFCLGGALVLLPDAAKLRRLLREALFAAGLVMIAIAIVAFRDDMRFPGLSAILPCAGAALVIYTANAPGRLGVILTNRVAVYVGKISYSVYLMHWPIIVFYKYWKFSDLVFAERIALTALSLACGALLQRFVEQPFRLPVRRSIKKSDVRFLAALAGCIAVLSVPAASAWSSNGWRLRFDSDRLQLLDIDRLKIFATYRSSKCYSGSANVLETFDYDLCLTQSFDKRNVLLIGDSHAAHLYPGLTTEFPNVHFLQANYSSCTPTMAKELEASQCAVFMRFLFGEFLPGSGIDAAILSGRWSRADIEPLRETIRRLKELGVEPIIFGRTVEYKKPLPEIVLHRGITDTREDLGAFLTPGLRAVNRDLQQLAGEEGVAFFNPLEAFCSADGRCRIAERLPAVFQWDTGHLTPEGSVYLIERLRTTSGLLN